MAYPKLEESFLLLKPHAVAAFRILVELEVVCAEAELIQKRVG